MTATTPSAGDDLGLPAVTRRSLLRASPALLAPALLAAPALASTADPLPSLFAEFRRVRQAWLDVSDDQDTPEALALWAERERLEDAIRTTVATTPAGLIAQVEFMVEDYGRGLIAAVGPTVDDMPVAFLDTITAGLRRLA